MPNSLGKAEDLLTEPESDDIVLNTQVRRVSRHEIAAFLKVKLVKR